MVLQMVAGFDVSGIGIALAEVDVKEPKTEIENGFEIEKTVMRGFDSDVDNVQVRLPTFLNSKRTELEVKAQL